ncbi:hypothetical protein [Hymenobacter metallicola]|uniref:Lipoprotein n=1 Tax=Hymenobacter metallicola TaxID=2563114 RepID=A0A4Z0QFN0_9BACT|nr:hypothetical protein [Hymenobacter metallicola]TGE28830.1 hypothetical protein E5K02_05045 [Hymenobacter metallicola]
MRAAVIVCLILISGCNSQEGKIKLKVPTATTSIHEQETKITLTDFAVIPNFQPNPVSVAELNQVDALLRACVTEFNKAAEADYADMQKAHPEIPFRKENYVIDLARYRKQLVVNVNSQGAKIVWVNCFCGDEADFPYWKKRIVDVTDGGNCFFNVRLNLTKGTWEDLRTNGVA